MDEILGPALAVLGAAMAAILGGIGSTIGSQKAASAAAGVTSEKPELSGKLIVLAALPSSQGVYGFVAAFMAMGKIAGEMTPVLGVQVFFACLPVAFTGLFSGLYQGKVVASGTQVIAKQPDKFGAAMIFAALIETFAIFGLLATLLLLGKF